MPTGPPVGGRKHAWLQGAACTSSRGAEVGLAPTRYSGFRKGQIYSRGTPRQVSRASRYTVFHLDGSITIAPSEVKPLAIHPGHDTVGVKPPRKERPGRAVLHRLGNNMAAARRRADRQVPHAALLT